MSSDTMDNLTRQFEPLALSSPTANMSADQPAALPVASPDAPKPTVPPMPDGRARPYDSDGNRSNCHNPVFHHLMANSAEFRELETLRAKGWNNTEGGAFFNQQRKHADEADSQTAMFFYKLMQKIADEMQRKTGAIRISSFLSRGKPRILDTCVAPGGFLSKALKINPNATALALTLSPDQGGHKCLFPETDRVETQLVDVTMLAADMGVTCIPTDHPDADRFYPRLLPTGKTFDLVLCDGHVLRTQERASYREKCEARRLTTSQLVLGLERLKPGGKLILLLHKIEMWKSVETLYAFSKFARIELFKPTAGHAKRSSFYLIAKNVQTESPECLAAIERWRETWHAATFPAEGEEVDQEEDVEWKKDPWTAEEVIEDFGPKLMSMAAPVWKIQTDALATAPFIKGAAR